MELNLKNVFEGIDSLASERGIAYLCFASLLTLGPLDIFVAYPKLYIELDTLKLMLLGLSLTLPAMFIAVMALIMGEGKRFEETRFDVALGGGAAAIFLTGAVGIGVTAIWRGGFWPFVLSEGAGIFFAWYAAKDSKSDDGAATQAKGHVAESAEKDG